MTITARGITTHYQKLGRGPTLVLLHGWGGDWQSWAPIIPTLSNHYRLIIPDLPAFGRSTNPHQPWNSNQYAQWLEAFVSEVAPSTQLAIIGHSFGGKVAARWVARYQPNYLQALVLIDAAGLPDPLTPKQQLIQNLTSFIPAGLKNSLPLPLKTKWLQKIGSATDHLHSTPEQRAILKVIVRENIAQELTTIHTPTLLVWGENDLDTPVHQAKKFAQLIVEAELHVIPAAGHFVFHDQPDQVLELVTKFLNSHLSQ